MTELFMGIDIGTTRVKAGAVTVEGHLCQFEAVATPWRGTDEGPVLDIDALGDLVLEVARRCARAVRARGQAIVGIGTTGMGETGALLDPRGTPMAPGFAWHHSLGDADGVQLALGRDTFAAITGHGCDLAPSIVKLDHLRRKGHVFRSGQRWLNIAEYISYRLSGEQACEFSLSGRTGLYDLRGNTWWTEALEFLGAGVWLLPGEPVSAGTPIGRVPAGIPELAGAVVTTAGHDHPVAATSVGAVTAGVLCYSLGTSEAQVRVVPPGLDADRIARLVQAGATVDRHPDGKNWYVLGTLPTGLTLERLARLLGQESTTERLALSRAALDSDDAVGAQLADICLDHFTIRGITSGDTPVGVWRMAVRNLVMASERLRDSVSEVIGPPQRQIVFGGWAHDPLVMQLRGQRGQLLVPGSPPEAGILGAAMAAAEATGLVMAAWP